MRFLVSFGGIAGLFLGFSLLSGVEVLYYFTMRACCMVYKEKNELRRMNKEERTKPVPDYDLSMVPYFVKMPEKGNGTKEVMRRLYPQTNMVTNTKNHLWSKYYDYIVYYTIYLLHSHRIVQDINLFWLRVIVLTLSLRVWFQDCSILVSEQDCGEADAWNGGAALWDRV